MEALCKSTFPVLPVLLNINNMMNIDKDGLVIILKNIVYFKPAILLNYVYIYCKCTANVLQMYCKCTANVLHLKHLAGEWKNYCILQKWIHATDSSVAIFLNIKSSWSRNFLIFDPVNLFIVNYIKMSWNLPLRKLIQIPR